MVKALMWLGMKNTGWACHQLASSSPTPGSAAFSVFTITDNAWQQIDVEAHIGAKYQLYNYKSKYKVVNGVRIAEIYYLINMYQKRYFK